MKDRIKGIILGRIKLYGYRCADFAAEEAARIIYETFIESDDKSCTICGDYHDKDSIPLSCQTGDGA